MLSAAAPAAAAVVPVDATAALNTVVPGVDAMAGQAMQVVADPNAAALSAVVPQATQVLQ